MDSPSLYAAIGFLTLLVTTFLMAYRRYRLHQNKYLIASSLSPSSLPTSLSPSSLPSSVSRNWRHQVFPSFRGEDVRRGFLSHIQKEFERKGITLFIDNDIDRSKSIGPELIEAIRRSKISVVLVSRNYASSTWCLNELVEIIKCRKELDQIVMIVFYEVDPTDVKKQAGEFGNVFEKTCVGKAVEDVARWREALEEVAKIAGYDSRSWNNEADMIEKVAEDVSNMLNTATPSSGFDGLVGIESHITEMSSVLSLASDEVRMVGIWGPAGIGKTTIARTLFSIISNDFTHTAFVESTKRRYNDDTAFRLHLQEQLLSKALDHKDLKIDHLGVAEARLKDKKVLVVLDDVEEAVQLQAMACKTHWFGCGSRIIITTKDIKVLKAHGINHVYHVDYPRWSEAREILCLSAFGQKSPYVGFEDLTMEVVRLAGKLPLGLSVFGSYMRGMSKEEWTHALPRLRTSLNGNIEKVLRLSYDALCDKDKTLFLHIACFFKNEKANELLECLEESDLDVKHGLQVLTERSLISINRVGYLVMHSLLQQMGKEIVRKEDINEHKRRRFLMDAHDICDVLSDIIVSGTVLGIDLDITAVKEELSIDERAFEGMSRLQFLRFYNDYNDNKLILPRGLNTLPRKLKLLQWHKFPMKFLPCKFRAEFLVNLKMQNSHLEKLWEGTPAQLRCLKRMDLSYSYNLRKVPDLSSATNLEALILTACKNLEEIPSSVKNLESLVELRLEGCPTPKDLSAKISLWKSPSQIQVFECAGLRVLRDVDTTGLTFSLTDTAIQKLPSWIKFLSHLHTLTLRKCHSLTVFPIVPNSIQELDLGETGIQEVPAWIKNLSRLTKLSMVGCKKLKIIPVNINMRSLSSLDLSHCTKLKTFPEISTRLERLNLENTGIEKVPLSIRSWLYLVELSMRGCKRLKVFSDIPDDSMEELDLCCEEEKDRSLHLDLNGCKNLISLHQLPGSLIYLDACNCELLETVDGYFYNPQVNLHFDNCLKLNQEARQLIQTSASNIAVLPGGEVPSYFHHQCTGSFLTIPFIKNRDIPDYLWFKACILLSPFSGTPRTFGVSWCIFDTRKADPVGHGLCLFAKEKLVRDHLFTFEGSFSLEKDKDHGEVSELWLVFHIVNEQRMKGSWKWESVESDSQKLRIMGCGVRFLDVLGDMVGSSYQVEEKTRKVKKANSFEKKKKRKRKKKVNPVPFKDNDKGSGDLSDTDSWLGYNNSFLSIVPRLPLIVHYS
ncbi:hypothetical protein N665_0385s0012 [Sinapis alba]|nr:hypothetical protein N665_0385s0012 [Sinapis alba]